MEFKERKIKGVWEIEIKPIMDERGFFMRTFDDVLFKNAGLNCKWVQENHSRTIKKGTIRGLHFQLLPFAETKLIRCIRGKVFDVFVDLRKDSPTFGQWDSIVLSEYNYKLILLPRGVAHGFCSIEDNCEIIYKVDNYYSPNHECGIVWDDTDLNIAWNCLTPILSDKDKKNLTLQQFIIKYKYIDI